MDNILSSEGFSGQTFKGIPVSIIERPVNSGEAHSYGGTLRTDFKRKWNAMTLNSYLAYTFIDGEIDGRQIPFTAQHTVKAVFDVNYIGLRGSIRYIYRSGSFHRSLRDAEGNLMSSDPYGIVNFSVRYLFLERDRVSTEAFLKINNLLNKRYYNVPVGGSESIRMAPQDPIRILLGIQVQI